MNTRVRGLAATFRRAFMLLVASTLLAACGGGGGGGNSPKNNPPVAKAGIDAVVREAETVTFDGRGSSDPDGTIAGYAWSTQADSGITLANPKTAQPALTAGDVETDTDIELTLEVTDNKDGKANDTLIVTVFRHVDGNTPPTPKVASVPDAVPGDPVVLDASGSFDEDGHSIVAYQWVQIDGPFVELFGVDSAIATFQAPAEIAAETVFLFRLFVTDNADAIGERNAIDVPVIVKPVGDQPPVANAGADQTVNAGGTVELDGTASGDVETAMEALQFAWVQTEGNETLAVTLDDPASVTPTFTLPEDIASETVLVFELTVTDEAQQIALDSVAVTVKPLVPGNQLPVANAGEDQTVTENDEVSLSGIDSDDPDGSIATYQWTQIGKPRVTLENANAANAYFITPLVTADTALRFRLTVTDDKGSVASDIVDVFIEDSNQRPHAIAKANGSLEGIEVIEGAAVSLDGSASIDDGAITSYVWSAEEGDIDFVVNPINPALASFVAPAVSVDTEFAIGLTVSDGELEDSDSISVMVKANRAPVADASADNIDPIRVNGGAAVTLNGSGSDPEGRDLKVLWTHLPAQDQQPIALEAADAFAPRFTAPNETVTFTFQLKVTDDHEQEATDTVRVEVVKTVAGNTAPVAVVTSTVGGDENSVFTLDGSASRDDDEGDSIASYQWTQTAGELVTLDLANPAKPTFNPGPVNANKTLKFQLVVADEHDVVSNPAMVTVTVRDTGPDTTPDPITFTPVTGAEIHRDIASNAVVVTGIDTPVAARVQVTSGSPGTFFMRVTRASDGSVATFSAGTINPFDRIELVTYPRSLGENVVLKLAFGDVASPVHETTWSVTAKLAGDLSPAPFDLQDVTGAAPGTESFTNVITPTGFDTASSVSFSGTGASFSVTGPDNIPRGNIVHPGEPFKIRVQPNSGNYEQTHAVTVRIGDTTDTFNYTTRARDTTPAFNPDVLPTQVGLEAAEPVTSVVQVTGFDESLMASVTGPDAANARLTVTGIGGEPASSLPVSAGKNLVIHALSPAYDIGGEETMHTVTLTVGTESRDFVIGTRAPNRVPGTFPLAPKTNAAVGAGVRSDPFTIPAVEVPVPVTITLVSDGATAMLLRNGTPVASDGSVSAGPEDTLIVELTTPDTVSITVSATVTAGIAGVGQQSAKFDVTTAAVDTTPANFDFEAITDAARGELIESNSVFIAGIADGKTAETSISGDEGASYAVRRVGETDFSTFTAGASTVANGDEIKVRVRASNDFVAASRALIDVGGRLEEFLVTSEADIEPPQVEITFPINGALFNAEANAGSVSKRTVFAKVTDNDSVAGVQINDQPAAFDSIVGQWKASLDVVPGENVIVVSAEDIVGNSGESQVAVYGETGMFANMEGLRWAGGKLYAGIDESNDSRILEINPVSGARRTIRLAGVNGIRDFIPDDRDDPTMFYVLTSVNDNVFTVDLATGLATPLSSSEQAPDIRSSYLQTVTNVSGTHLLAFVGNTTAGAQLVEVHADGSREVRATIDGYTTAGGMSVAGTTGWLFAKNSAGTEGVIVRLDLSDLASVDTGNRRTVSAETLAPVSMTQSTRLQVDFADESAEPRLFVSGFTDVIALQSDRAASTWVTGSNGASHGTGPLPRGIAYVGMEVNPDGELYLLDNNWSMVLSVEQATGNRLPVSGLHRGVQPVTDAFPFVNNNSDPPAISVLENGSVVIDRQTSHLVGSVISDGVATYNVADGVWQYLLNEPLETRVGIAFDYLPISSTGFLVGHNDWPGGNRGFGRVFQDATGIWQEELFSVSGDGKGSDWANLYSGARDPLTGDIWVIDSVVSSGVRTLRLWQVDGESGERTLAMTLPDAVDGHSFITTGTVVHRIAFDDGGRLFWLAYSSGPNQTRLFEIHRDDLDQPVTLFTDSSDVSGSHDLATDDNLKWLYLVGGERVVATDIALDSPTEGRTHRLPSIPFPGFNHGINASQQSSAAFDVHRRRLWIYHPAMHMVYLVQPDTGEAVMLPKH